MTIPAHETLRFDWCGMQCPQPIIQTAKAARELQGRPARLVIQADDPAFPMDLQAWVKSAKAELLHIVELPDRPGVHEATILINPQAPLAASARQVTSPHAAVAAPAAQAPAPQSIQAPQRAQASGSPGEPQALDCRGMRCPEPVLAIARASRAASPGQIIHIQADDPAFPMDLQAWVKSAKAELLELNTSGDQSVATVCLAGQPAPTKAAAPAAPAAQPSPGAASPATHAAPTPDVAARPASSAELRLELGGLSAEAMEQRLGALSMLGLKPGARVELLLDDAARVPQLTQWALSGGHAILAMNTSASPILIELALATQAPQAPQAPQGGALVHQPAGLSSSSALAQAEDRCTLLVLHNDLEALLAAMLVANGAAAQGMQVELFFSFWGVNLLRGDSPRKDAPVEPVSLPQRLFKFLMPRGPRRQALGQLNFGGMGSAMLSRIMRQKNVMPLEDLVKSALDLGVKFTVCTMSMSVMGITRRDLMDLPNMELAGVAAFVERASRSRMSMVF